MRFNKLKKLMEIACNHDASVLITGATGTGKTTLAKEIHECSLRKNSPFVTVNLATLHEGLLESELFGHEKGAYTGANQKRKGRFESAAGGTVFLDEIGELSPRLQARLLDFIQFKSLTPVGGNQSVQLDVRVIAATHQNLEEAVRRGEFREDLFHRLRIISIHLPSLEERCDEIDSIIHSLLSDIAERAKKPILRLSAEVAERFEVYRWPGNLRELKNVLEFAVMAADDVEIQLTDLPEWIQKVSLDSCLDLAPLRLQHRQALGVADIGMSLDYADTFSRFEKEYLTRALSRHRGRVNQTARQIGLNKTTLLRRIRAYGIDVTQ